MKRGYVLAKATAVAVALCGIVSLAADAPDRAALARGLDFVVFCRDNFVVADQRSGLSGIDLTTGRKIWTALTEKKVDVGPAAAGDTVAVITDSFDSVRAFSRLTGQLLWQRPLRSPVLAADGRFFYVARSGDDGVSALDSRTGAVVWTVKIWPRGGATFLRVNNGLLYSNTFVVELRARRLIHQWPEDVAVTAIAFPGPGETVVGDSAGNITLYDSAFRPTNRLRAGNAQIEAMAANGEGVLLSLRAESRARPGRIEFLTWKGERKWTVAGLPIDYMGFDPFVIAGNSALIVSPDSETQGRWQVQSRTLATGKVNWTGPTGDYYNGMPVTCGGTAYLRDGDRIVGLDVANGASYYPPSGRAGKAMRR